MFFRYSARPRRKARRGYLMTPDLCLLDEVVEKAQLDVMQGLEDVGRQSYQLSP